MNATSKLPKSHTEIAEQAIHEHDLLLCKVKRIHDVIAGSEPEQSEIDELLHEFLSALVLHFSNEENEGFFNEVCAHAPRLADRAGQLCIEHVEILHEANELCQFAAAGSPSLTWWRELQARCHELTKRLMNHEREENRLIQEAYLADIGAHD